ncbi:deoxyribodipyrimidine photo-lyase [Escherichia coli]
MCAENSVTHLFYNYQYEVNERARDVDVERALRNVVCEGFDDSVILPPGAVMSWQSRDVQSLYAFKNAWLKRLREGMPECVAAPKVRSSGSIKPAPSITLNYPRQYFFDTAHFPVEEKAAIAQLRQFCQNGAGEYEQQRDFPAVGKAPPFVRQPGNGRVITSPVFASPVGGTAAGAGRWGR